MRERKLCPPLATNGFAHSPTGLGLLRAFDNLREVRMTQYAKAVLRMKYGYPAVEVSCKASFNGNAWNGDCEIDGKRCKYRISRESEEPRALWTLANASA